MAVLFYICAALAVVTTGISITRANPVHALLWLIVSLFAAAILFFLIGAPFVAALEIIIYAGAIIVLFVFVVMLLGLGEEAVRQERRWLRAVTWIGPILLGILLIVPLAYILWSGQSFGETHGYSGPKEVGGVLFSTYLLGVEIASMMLLGGLVAAYHLGRRQGPGDRRGP